MLLTANQVTEAIGRLPKHRVSLRKSLMLMLSLIEHGKEVKDNAPAWIQARNAIYVATIDNGHEAAETTSEPCNVLTPAQRHLRSIVAHSTMFKREVQK